MLSVMITTPEHIERLIISRLLFDIFNSPDRATINLPHKDPRGSLVSSKTIASSTSFFELAKEQLRLDERIAHTTLKPVAGLLKEIAERYTSSRESTISPLNASECQAYALYYTLINLEKTRRILSLCDPALFKKKLNVLDYGAGPGTACMGLATLTQEPFSVTAADSNPEMRKICQLLLDPLKENQLIQEYSVVTPDKIPDMKFDLILASHVINELPVSDHQNLVKKLLSYLSQEGTLLLLESALPEQTRQLMRCRDQLLESDHTLNLIFPCTHKNSCPMLRNSNTDWCHGSLNWTPPHLIRQLDQLTGFNKHEIKYSAFLMTRGDRPDGTGTRHYRVVGPPQQNKTGHSLALCGEDYFGISNLRKRARSEKNTELRRAEQFDLLTIDGDEMLGAEFSSNLLVRRSRAP